MLLFVLASVACGLASSLPLLIAARLVQGVGAALVAPTSLSLIREAYDDTGERARALGYWALGGSLAAAAGPIVGGALALVNWLLIFFLNLPVGIIALGVLRAVAPSPRRAASFDWLGQLTAFVTMAGFYGTVFLQSLYFPQQRGLSALDSGLLFLPMTALVAVASPLVARIVRRVGPVAPSVGGSLGVASSGPSWPSAPPSQPGCAPVTSSRPGCSS